jgi:hypothetical protein
MTDAPCKTHGYQRLVPIVAVGLVFEANIDFVCSRCVTNGPVLMNPPAVYCECKRGGKQPIKRRVDAVFRDIATLCRIIEIAKQRQDRFVGNR